MGKTSTYYMGKMGIVDMGNIDGSENESRSIWTEEEGLHDHANAGGSGNTRQQSENTRHQSQRTNRAYSSDKLNVSLRETPAGGTVCQLINDYRDQVASKQALIEQTQGEIDYLRSRIEQFEELKSSLEQSSE
jgi:hypothetical protein